MRPRHGDYARVLGGDSFGGIEAAIGGKDRDGNVARCGMDAELVHALADIGLDDVHINEDDVQIGHCEREVNGVAAAVRRFGDEVERSESAGQVAGGGDRRHGDDGSVFARAIGEPGEGIWHIAGTGVRVGRVDRHDGFERSEADAAIGAAQRLGKGGRFAIGGEKNLRSGVFGECFDEHPGGA